MSRSRAGSLAGYVAAVLAVAQGSAAATVITTRAETLSGPTSGSDTDTGGPDAAAESSYEGILARSEFHVDADDLDFHVGFSIDPGSGEFDPIRQWYYARGNASYAAPLLISAGPAGGAGSGTIRFQFSISGDMDIDGNPVPSADPRYNVEQFNQLTVNVGGTTETVFRVSQDAGSSHESILGLYLSDPIPIDFTEPNTLTVSWQGGAEVRFSGGQFTIGSDFLGTASLTGIELRDGAGTLLAGTVTDDEGRVFRLVPEPGTASLLACALLGLGIDSARRVGAGAKRNESCGGCPRC